MLPHTSFESLKAASGKIIGLNGVVEGLHKDAQASYRRTISRTHFWSDTTSRFKPKLFKLLPPWANGSKFKRFVKSHLSWEPGKGAVNKNSDMASLEQESGILDSG